MDKVSVPELLSPREEVVQILAEGLFAMIVHRLEPTRRCGYRPKIQARGVEGRGRTTAPTRRNRR